MSEFAHGDSGGYLYDEGIDHRTRMQRPSRATSRRPTTALGGRAAGARGGDRGVSPSDDDQALAPYDGWVEQQIERQAVDDFGGAAHGAGLIASDLKNAALGTPAAIAGTVAATERDGA